MRPAIRAHDLRPVTDLRGLWDFAFLGDVDPDTLDPAALAYDDRMTVPGCFDATPAYAGRRGLTAYRTRVTLADTCRHRLVLDGVHHWCRVFVGGRAVGDHVGGFTRFHLDFTPESAGEAELVVLLDNRIDYDRCPLHLEYFDWYHFGGITRTVELHRLGRLWIDAVRVETVDAEARRVKVAVDIGRWGEGAAEAAELTLAVNGAEKLRESADASAGTLERIIELPAEPLWSPEEPNLHTLAVSLGGDDFRVRFGIRQVEVAGREIRVNGRAVRLKGFCRHEAHPQFGHAVPADVQLADVQLLREMGVNFIRGSHYPQDERFLDLCDEAGILVWSESIGWQHRAEQLNDPNFLQAQLLDIDEMVAAAFNHPCVILWGILNESRSDDPAARPGYQTLLARLRELDPSRPVTYACNHLADDVCLDLVDVVSINCYPGWYHGGIDDIGEHLDELFALADAKGHGDKPLIVSEIGGGAIYGWRDLHETRWSEQYQAKLLDAVLEHLFVAGDRAAGVAIWQYCDCRTNQTHTTAIRRPRCFNNKGVVDEYRRPKLAFDVVRRHFRGR
jgi:beta-glucuronidase